MRLLGIEIERCLRRRVVWALLAIAVAGIAVLGVIAFLTVDAPTMTEWWRGKDDSILLTGAIFLLLGGVIGGAAVAGGEWRTGSMATVLTWEPRRARLLASRLGAMAIAAFVIAVGLQGLLLLATLPAMLGHGSTAGADGAFAAGVALAMLRIAAVTAVATCLGASIASVSKNTTVAVVAVWAWVGVVESILRGAKPGWTRWLLVTNVAKAVSWTDLGEASGPSPLRGSVLLAAYGAILAAVAILHFRRVDAISG